MTRPSYCSAIWRTRWLTSKRAARPSDPTRPHRTTSRSAALAGGGSPAMNKPGDTYHVSNQERGRHFHHRWRCSSVGRQQGKCEERAWPAVHRLLLCVPLEPESQGVSVAEGEVRQLRPGSHVSRPVRQGLRRHGDLPADLPDGLLQERLQHDREKL